MFISYHFSKIPKDITKAIDLNKERDLLISSLSSKDDKNLALLLFEGADPNTIDNYGKSLLMLAIEKKSFACADLLIKRGANVNFTRTRFAPQKNGYFIDPNELILDYLETPLHFAIYNNDIKFINYLVSNKARITLKHPLHLAAKLGHIEAINYLIKAGADIYARNNQYFTPREAVRDFLLSNRYFINETWQEHLNYVQLFLRNKENEGLL